jgi:hypothetical protein
MPLYDCRDWPTVEAIWPSRVLDADGKEIPDVVWCDTESGRVGRQVNDAAGSPMLTADLRETVLVEETYAAPLKLESIPRREPMTAGG